MPAKKALTIKDEDAQSMVDRIIQFEKQIDIDLPETTDGLWELTVRLENEHAVNTAKRGLAYMMLKDQLGHGEFVKGLQDRDISPRRAQESMQAATLLMNLPSSKARSIAHLGGSKLIELARIPVDDLEDLDEQGELDDIDTMSLREIKAHVRKLRKQVVNEAKARENAEILAAQATQGDKTDRPEWPAPVVMLRTESTSLADKAGLCLDDMQQLKEFIFNDSNFTGCTQEEMNAGISALYHNVRMLAAKACNLSLELEETYGAEIKNMESIPVMTKTEMARIMSARKLMTDEHAVEKQAREAATKATKPRGRGRPRKTAAK